MALYARGVLLTPTIEKKKKKKKKKKKTGCNFIKKPVFVYASGKRTKTLA